MKNIMLGHSGVGKTTYVAAVYKAMQQTMEGFTLTTEQTSDHNHLIELGKHIRDGQYPLSTDLRTQYEFRLCFSGDPVCHFTWADYRGGALDEDSASADAKQLLADLKEADSLMVFYDTYAARTNSRLASQIGRMNNLISRAVQEIDHIIPLVVVLTKSDLVDTLDDQILRPVHNLLDAVKASDHIVGTSIAVACGQAERNLALPVLFVLHHGIALQVASFKKQAKALHKAAKKLRREQSALEELRDFHQRRANNHPVWDRVWEVVFGDSDRMQAGQRGAQATQVAKKAKKAAKKAKKNRRQLEPLLEPARRLEAYLKDLSTF